jgi:hypothetical protein
MGFAEKMDGYFSPGYWASFKDAFGAGEKNNRPIAFQLT